MKHIKKIIFFGVIIIGISLLIYSKFSKRIIYNSGYVNGNTAGNLYNAGLFCESNGTIFFANPDDHYYLYFMSPTGQNLKLLCEDTVSFINADDHYVYYVRNNMASNNDYSFFTYNQNSLCRITRDGKNHTILDEDPCIYASLIGNYIYYLHYDTADASTLYKIKIDGTEKTQLSGSHIFTCSSLDKYFYYSSPENGLLYQFDTSTDTSTMMLDTICYNPIVNSEKDVYYLDVKKDNALIHTNLDYNNPVNLCDEFIELYNVYGSYIFFQKGGENPALCMIKNDGTGYREIVAGEFKNISVTSFYIYFTDYYTGKVYCTSTNNPGTILNFNPAKIK